MGNALFWFFIVGLAVMGVIALIDQNDGCQAGCYLVGGIIGLIVIGCLTVIMGGIGVGCAALVFG